MTDESLTRLSVNMNSETTEQLRRLAYDKGLTYTETVRRAISIMAYFDNVSSLGETIQVVDEVRNAVREVIIF